MSPLVLALLLGADAVAAPPPPTETERLLASQVGVSLGITGSGYQVHGSRWGDTLFSPVVTARGVFKGFLVEGSVLGAFPVTSGGAATALTGLGRLGYVGQHFSLHVGATAQWANASTPAFQVLPSFRLEGSFGLAGLSVGLFDFHGQVPLHLSAEVPTRFGHFSLGYVAPLGVVATADVPLTGALGVRAQAWAYQLFASQQALFTVGLTYGGAR